jgi:hypothetical protein
VASSVPASSQASRYQSAALHDIFKYVVAGGEPDGTEIEIPTPLLDDAGRVLERVSLADVADAYLYLGPIDSLTLAEPAGRAVEERSQ